MRVAFFCFAKRKSPKKRRPCCACPFAALRATAMLGQRVRRRTHCALRAPFKQLRRVSGRSACVLRHTHAPSALRFSAHTEGNSRRGHPHGPLLRSACVERSGAAATRCARGAKRSDGPCGCWLLAVGCWLCSASPHLAAPASGRFRGGMRVGARMLRPLIRRGCPSGARSAKRVPRGTPQPPRGRFAP